MATTSNRRSRPDMATSGSERWLHAPRVRGVDALARDGFGRGAKAYERARPAYPRRAVAWVCAQLRVAASQQIFDLGAGTGKLGRLVRELTGTEVIAVEPVAEMRAIAAAHGLAVLDGTAEDLPAADGSVENVVCGEAFHWFDARRALGEIARVLRDGGGIGLLWNVHCWDRHAAWVRAIEALLAPQSDRRPQTRYGSGQWRVAFELDRRWAPLNQRSFHHEQRLSRAGLVDHVASVAYVAALPQDERSALLAEVARIADDLPEEIDIPYRTDVYVTRLVGA
jgi:SAM-dependent methyltransferase